MTNGSSEASVSNNVNKLVNNNEQQGNNLRAKYSVKVNGSPENYEDSSQKSKQAVFSTNVTPSYDARGKSSGNSNFSPDVICHNSMSKSSHQPQNNVNKSVPHPQNNLLRIITTPHQVGCSKYVGCSESSITWCLPTWKTWRTWKSQGIFETWNSQGNLREF